MTRAELLPGQFRDGDTIKTRCRVCGAAKIGRACPGAKDKQHKEMARYMRGMQ